MTPQRQHFVLFSSALKCRPSSCYNPQTLALQRAGVHRSDVDFDSGRTTNRHTSRARRRPPPREQAAIVGEEQIVDKRARRLRRESNNSNGDRKERRRVRSAVAAPVRPGREKSQQDAPNKKTTDGKKGNGKSGIMKRRLSKEGGMQMLKYSSSEAADLSDSSGSGNCGGGDKGNGGAQRDKPRGRDSVQEKAGKPRAVSQSTDSKEVVNISQMEGGESSSVPAAAPDPAPARYGSKNRSSQQDGAGVTATNSRGRGNNDLLGALMGGPPMQRATSVDSSTPPQPAARPMIKKRPSSDNLLGRANTAERSSLSGRDRIQLKRAESLDSVTARRNSLSTGCHPLRPEAAPGQDARPLGSIPELSSKPSENPSTGSGTAGAPTKRPEKRRADLTDGRRADPAKKARPAGKEDPPASISKKPVYTRVGSVEGVVRKVSNGKFFLWVHDKLHDGKPYDR